MSDMINPQIPTDDRLHLDEGWWSSVMAEEDSIAEDRTLNNDGIDKQVCQTDWGMVHQLYDSDKVITLDVDAYNRGGLLVKRDQIHGFVPISHLIDMPADLDPEARDAKLAAYLGRELNLKVIEFDPDQERIVFSERAALAGSGTRKALLESIKPGETLSGKVTNITDFGVFVDLGGLEGLIHVSELSWGKVSDPHHLVAIDQQLDVVVLNVNELNERVALSLKRSNPNPWCTLLDNFTEGQFLNATVSSVAKFGIFAKLDLGIEGLIHKSSLTPQYIGANLQSIFPPGRAIIVRILHIDCDRHRLGLGLVED